VAKSKAVWTLGLRVICCMAAYLRESEMESGMKYKQGDKVMANGFPGVIVRFYASTTWEVRLPGGLVAVCERDITPL
jgi:hypothetical protein